MGGDVEFVNTFMAKMKDKLHDHLGQVMMLETHLEITNKRLEELQSDNEKLNKDIELKETNYGILMGEKEKLLTKVDKLETDLLNSNDSLNSYKNIAEKAVEELNRVREQINNKSDEEKSAYISQINTLQNEIDSCRKMEQTLIKDFTDLQKKYEEAINPKPLPVKKTTK